MRWLCALAAGSLLVGCGSMTAQPAAPIVPDAPAPPIAAVNDAPPEEITWFLRAEFGYELPSGDTLAEDQGVSGCMGTITVREWTSSWGDVDDHASCDEPSPEEDARWQAEEQRYQQVIRPASDTEPRVLARLPLGGADELVFTAWKNDAGALCWELDESGPDGSGGGGPSGPCAVAATAEVWPEATAGLASTVPPCAAICLESNGGSMDGQETRYALGGTVAGGAEALRVTVAGGGSSTYPLIGPTVLGTGRRVFLLDLGATDWRKLELIEGGAVVATSEMPAFIVAYEDCSERLGPWPEPPEDADMQAAMDGMREYNQKLSLCMAASGALDSSPAIRHSFP